MSYLSALSLEIVAVQDYLALLILASGLLAAYFWHLRLARKANDVLGDLKAQKLYASESLSGVNSSLSGSEKRSVRGYIFGDQLAQAGYITVAARDKFKRQLSKAPLLGVLFIVGLWSIFGPYTVFALCYAALLGFGLGHFYNRIRLSNQVQLYQRALEFYLPLIMERIVMAVQAGLDVLPAIKVVLEHGAQETNNTDLDPVSELLELVLRLSESGLSFEQALKDVAEGVENSALKHAFIHLGIAQKQGGELVMPLRELSDSTQLYYQESVEEMIAKMPAKATLPLICTFLGLLLTFLTTPLLQILSLMQKGAQL